MACERSAIRVHINVFPWEVDCESFSQKQNNIGVIYILSFQPHAVSFIAILEQGKG